MKPGHYSIPLTGLKEGSHQYEFEIDNDFFTYFEESEISDAKLAVEVLLVKRSAHMELVIGIKGFAGVECDRCLEPYMQEVNIEGKLLVKFGEEWEEVDDEVLIIPNGESLLDISQLIYEYAHLGLPLQKHHPEDARGISGCDPDMLGRIYGIETNSFEENKDIDPRWKDLGSLKSDMLN